MCRRRDPARQLHEQRWQDDTAYAFEREAGTSRRVQLEHERAQLPFQHLHVPPGTVFVDALGSGATFTVDAEQKLSVRVPAHAVVILTNTP